MAVVNLGNDSLLMGRRRRRSRRRAAYQEPEEAASSAIAHPTREPEPQAQPEPEPEPQQEPDAPQTMGRGYRRVSLRSFIKSFRKMNKAQRRAAWRAIPKAQKAAWLFVAGPILLPLIAAAGVAVTSTAALMPVTTAALIARRRRKRGGGRTPHTLTAFIRNFRRMSPAERRAAWRAIPRYRKAAWLLLAGPVILPMLAAAGIVITSTAAAAPFALLAIRSRIKKRRARLAALRRQQVQAHERVLVTGDTKAIVEDTNLKSEIATETNALKSDEDQVSTVNKDAGGTGEEEKTPEVSPEAVAAAEAGGVKKKSNMAAALPLAALAALMFL